MITEGHLGRRLKKTSISAIERSVESDRRRVFTVQEVVAFAPTFDVAALWFLIPPPDQNLAPRRLRRSAHAAVANRRRNRPAGRGHQRATHRTRLRESVSTEGGREAALDFEPGVTLGHFEGRRLDGLIDIVEEERNPLDDLLDEMKRLLERYESLQTRFALMADTPRRAYLRTSEVILVHKVWELIAEKHGNDFPGSSLIDLADRTDVPWESLINTDRPEVRDAILQFADAIEPDLRAYRFGDEVGGLL